MSDGGLFRACKAVLKVAAAAMAMAATVAMAVANGSLCFKHLRSCDDPATAVNSEMAFYCFKSNTAQYLINSHELEQESAHL